MENRELDILVLAKDFLREGKRLFFVGIVLILLCGGAFLGYEKLVYVPYYEASVSFTVRIADPLFASVDSYNPSVARQMAKTIPSILTGDVLRQRVTEGMEDTADLTIAAVSESNVITLIVTDTDPYRAQQVLDRVLECYPEISEYVVGPTQRIAVDEHFHPAQCINPFRQEEPIVKGGLLGVALWACVAAFLALSRGTVRDENDLKKILNLECLGQIPHVPLGRKAFCPMLHSVKHPGFPESIRLLRIRVEKIMGERGSKVLLVSGAIPGEGKTTVSVNLALSLAEKGSRVVLVDSDLRNPSVDRILGAECSLGLTDYLTGQADIRDILLGTDVENLTVIPGGTVTQDSYAELLGGERAAALIRHCRENFDFVIMDTPPCSMLADASEAAELADWGLLVIRRDYASRDQILDGAERLSDWGLPLIGCVLNRTGKGLSGYGYE